MSAVSVMSRIFIQKNKREPALTAVTLIASDLPEWKQHKVDFYYWYYASLALNQIDGPDAPKKTNKYWGPWNKAMVDAVLVLQDHTERDCRNGGWMVRDRWTYDGGPVYTTALNTLTLEVYYRYENAFGNSQRK